MAKGGGGGGRGGPSAAKSLGVTQFERGGSTFFRVGGENGRIFSSKTAASNFARRQKTATPNSSIRTSNSGGGRSGRRASRANIAAQNEARRQSTLRI